MQVHASLIQVIHRNQGAALLLAQVHQRADIIVGGVNVGIHKWFFRLGNAGRVGVGGGGIDHFHRAVRQGQPVLNTGGGGDQVKVKLALQPLGDDFHV